MNVIADRVRRPVNWEERLAVLYRFLPYVALISASLLSAVTGTPHLTGTLAIAVVAAGWATWFIVLHPEWTSRRRLMVVYYVGLLTLAAVLVLRSPWFGLFAWVGFVHAFIALPGGWRLVGVAGSAVLVATSQSGGFPRSGGHWVFWTVILLFNFGVAGAVSWFNSVTVQEHAKRGQLVDELAEANRRLADTVRENEGLHAQLLVQAREAGILDERQRMAREIHDTLAQGLIGVVTQLEAAEQARDRQGDWQRHVGHAAALARESLAEARRSVRAVRPEPLETARLPDALAELTRRWSVRHEVAAELVTTGTPRRLRPEVEVTLLRAGQEALANVARHAAATRVGLTLSYMEDVVSLDVRDDGMGFRPERGGVGDEPIEAGGFGLTAMRQRVDEVGGELVIESEPGTGTTVCASVPVLPVTVR